MLRAATVHAAIAMKRDQVRSRTSVVVRRITTHAVIRLTTILTSWCGKRACAAISTDSHWRVSQMIGSVSGSRAAAIRRNCCS
jgi:hypothetical protein